MRSDERGSRPGGRQRGSGGSRYEDLGTVLRRRDRPLRRRRSPGGIVALAIVLLLVAGVGAFLVAYLHRQSSLPATLAPAPARQAIIFVVQGATPADLSRAGLPNIRDLRGLGMTYREASVGQMEDLPVPSAATLGTGSFPRHTGIVGTEWREANSGALVSVTNTPSVLQGQIDQLMETAAPPSLAATVKGSAHAAPVVSIGGVGCAAASAAGTWQADYVICPIRARRSWHPAAVAGHTPPASFFRDRALVVRAPRTRSVATRIEGWKPGAQDDWVAAAALRAIRAFHPTLTIVSFPELGILRRYLPPRRAATLTPVIAGIDRDIGRVVGEIRREGQENRTVFVVTSDGGQARLSAPVPLSSLRAAVLSAGGQAVYYQPGNTVLIGLRDILQAQPVAQALQTSALKRVDEILYKKRAGGAYRYAAQYLNPALPPGFSRAASRLSTTMASAISPDVIIVFKPGAGTRGARLRRLPNVATSLGMQWPYQHIPLIVAGHGVLENATSSYPARLVDIAPTVAGLLGHRLRGADGIVLADAFIHPDRSDLSTERALAASLNADIQALRAEAAQ